jgi:hypothetical protein
VVADNFDADIMSQNGKPSSHSLAVLFTQKEQDDMFPNQQETIKRIHKSELSKSVAFDLQIERFNGSPRGSQKTCTFTEGLAQKALVRQ